MKKHNYIHNLQLVTDLLDKLCVDANDVEDAVTSLRFILEDLEIQLDSAIDEGTGGYDPEWELE